MTIPAIESTASARAEACGSIRWDGSPCSDFGDVQIVTAGCVHEHIRTGPLCRVCRHTLAVGGMNCSGCLEGRESHCCALSPGPSR